MYDRFYDDVYAYVFRRTGPDQVEDIVASVFLTTWRKIEEIPQDEAALFWLYRVAYRTIGNHWRGSRRQKRLKAKLDGLGTDRPTPPEDFIVQDEESRHAIEATTRLKDIDREVLLLSVWEQLAHEDIAEILETSQAAVKQRLYRARKNFATEFGRVSQQPQFLPTAREGGAR